MKKILLIGGGGHCRSVLDCIVASQDYDEIGIVDKEPETSVSITQYAGTDNDLSDLYDKGWGYAFITVGSIGDVSIRRKLYDYVTALGFKVPVIADPTARIANDVVIGPGTFFGKGSIVNAGTRIGNCAIVNTGSIIEHDCVIGDFAHVSPGAVLCGEVCVGEDSHVGAGSVIRQRIAIGKNVVIGAGSTVIKDIPDDSKVYGNPGRIIEK